MRRLALAHSLEWSFPLVGDEVVLDHLSRDPEPAVRIAIARAAWARRSGDADTGVLARLADDPDPDVRAVAVMPSADREADARRTPRDRCPRGTSDDVLETLAKGFKAARQRLTGVAELDDAVIDEALREVRLSLLEGDVEFGVVKRFLDASRRRRAARRSSSAPRARSTAPRRSRPSRRSSRSARTSSSR